MEETYCESENGFSTDMFKSVDDANNRTGLEKTQIVPSINYSSLFCFFYKYTTYYKVHKSP